MNILCKIFGHKWDNRNHLYRKNCTRKKCGVYKVLMKYPYKVNTGESLYKWVKIDINKLKIRPDMICFKRKEYYWIYTHRYLYRKYMKIIDRLGTYHNLSHDFDILHKVWLRDFMSILKWFNSDFSKSVSQSLFYQWEMSNWKAMHIENSEYKDYSKEELIEEFLKEVSYCSDRMSYDRLFRCHWLFRQAFWDELYDVK